VASGADALVLVTDWLEYKSIDWIKISKLMRVRLALDGRNHLNVQAASEAGVKVIGIGK
jgi:UDPglucose 6-dehydrogenase